MSEPVLKVAAKAFVVDSKGRVLILLQSAKYEKNTKVGQYQAPGGKLEPGESYEEALNREVLEETGLIIEPLFPIYVGDWTPVIKGVPHHIVGIFTICRPKTTKVRLSTAHDDYKWIDPKDYKKYDIMDPEDKVFERYNEWNLKDHNMLGYIDL